MSMAYPKPLETVLGRVESARNLLAEAPSSDVSDAVESLCNAVDGLVDWLVAQRESERASEQRPNEVPETLPTGSSSLHEAIQRAHQGYNTIEESIDQLEAAFALLVRGASR